MKILKQTSFMLFTMVLIFGVFIVSAPQLLLAEDQYYWGFNYSYGTVGHADGQDFGWMPGNKPPSPLDEEPMGICLDGTSGVNGVCVI